MPSRSMLALSKVGGSPPCLDFSFLKRGSSSRPSASPSVPNMAAVKAAKSTVSTLLQLNPTSLTSEQDSALFSALDIFQSALPSNPAITQLYQNSHSFAAEQKSCNEVILDLDGKWNMLERDHAEYEANLATIQNLENQSEEILAAYDNDYATLQGLEERKKLDPLKKSLKRRKTK